MAADDKKIKTTTPAKSEPKSEPVATKAKEVPAKTESTPAAEAPKSESSETAVAAPKSYSRGEGQKPVTQAYKDNWNAIFGKKDSSKKTSAKKSKKKR